MSKEPFKVGASLILTALQLVVCTIALILYGSDRVVYVNAKNLETAKFSVHINNLCSVLSGGYFLINSVLIITFGVNDRNLDMEAIFMVLGTALNLICGFVCLFLALKYKRTYLMMFRKKEWEENTYVFSVVFAVLLLLNGIMMLIDSILVIREINTN